MFWCHRGIFNPILEETFSGVTAKTSLIGLEATITSSSKRAIESVILKCSECGNTFQRDGLKDGEIVTCPICDAGYKVSIKEGKVKLEDFVYESEDFELL